MHRGETRPAPAQAWATTTLGILVNTLAQAAGPQSWPTHVQFRCGEASGEMTLTLTGNVIPTVSVEPAGLGIYTESSLTREVTLLDRRPEPLAVRVAFTTSPKLRASVGEPQRDAEGGPTAYTIDSKSRRTFPKVTATTRHFSSIQPMRTSAN